MRGFGRLGRLIVVFSAVALFATACSGSDDDSGSSTDSTTTTEAPAPPTTASNNPPSNAAIEEVQRELNLLGCDAGPLDGELGPDTVGAIEHFQSAAGIGVDGIVGPQTRAALETAAQTGNPNCRTAPPPPSTAPPASTTTTTSGGANQPNCQEDLINAGVTSGLLPGEVVNNSGPFVCSGDWATVSPTVSSSGGPQIEITVLLRWNGSVWQTVDRSVYCENGEVPQQIYQQACESN